MFPKDASKYNLVETIDLQEEAVFKVVIPSIQLLLPVIVVFLGPISIHECVCLILLWHGQILIRNPCLRANHIPSFIVPRNSHKSSRNGCYTSHSHLLRQWRWVLWSLWELTRRPLPLGPQGSVLPFLATTPRLFVQASLYSVGSRMVSTDLDVEEKKLGEFSLFHRQIVCLLNSGGMDVAEMFLLDTLPTVPLLDWLLSSYFFGYVHRLWKMKGNAQEASTQLGLSSPSSSEAFCLSQYFSY